MKSALLFLILLAPLVTAAECDDAYDSMIVTRDMQLCNRVYDAQNGITINTHGVTLDCNGAVIRGTGLAEGQGIIINNANDVTVKNCNIINYKVGIYVKESNRNHIYQNLLLKNKIGIRLLQSFENKFEKNADKSHLKPISSIASKFNTLWLTNKNIEKSFCEVNLCNTEGEMNPCADGDFYCSPKCNYDNDDDCKPPEIERIYEYPAFEGEPAVRFTEPAKKYPKLATGTVTKSYLEELSEKTRFWVMTLLFIVAYLIAFLGFQHHHRHH